MAHRGDARRERARNTGGTFPTPLPESAMPVVTPTRLPFVHTLLQRAAALRHDATLGAVTVAALCAAGLVVALGPLPVQALLGCA